MKKILLLVGIFAAFMVAPQSPAQTADPCVLVGKDTRSGVATEIWRGKPITFMGQTIEVSPKITLNVLTLTSIKNQTFSDFTRLDDKTVYTGLGVGYDVYQSARTSVRVMAGYTANMSDPLNRVRTGDWGVGFAFRYNF